MNVAETDLASVILSFTQALGETKGDIGEVKGQLRELIHSTNNQTQIMHGIDTRVAGLEAGEHRREGQNGVISALMKSPALGWFIGAAITAWAILTGKVNL